MFLASKLPWDFHSPYITWRNFLHKRNIDKSLTKILDEAKWRLENVVQFLQIYTHISFQTNLRHVTVGNLLNEVKEQLASSFPISVHTPIFPSYR